MLNLSDLREKEIINTHSGERMGYIYDFELDLDLGAVTGIVISGGNKMLSLFGKTTDIIIPWKDISKIGTDIILVDYSDEITD